MGKDAEIKLESERICEGRRQEGREGAKMKGRATGHNTTRCYRVKLGGGFNMIPEARLSGSVRASRDDSIRKHQEFSTDETSGPVFG